ncbi:MAG: FHA domain-containing protein, partial [Pirellulaceae bacterium]|nr:FHA domain-containing protein [Pirellulaceae bacterium]
MTRSAIQIEIRSAPDAGKRFVFDHGPITFGRADANVLTIGHRYASRKHGEIQFADGYWRLTVLGYNTTTVNGRKVRGQSRQLNDQDLVAIGNEPLF